MRGNSIDQSLNGGSRRNPCVRNAVGGSDVALCLGGDGHDRLKLQWVADCYHSTSPPNRPDCVLRTRLPGFIDKYPSQRLPAQTSEHPSKGCERRRDHWHDQKKQLPRRTHLFLLQTIWVNTSDDFDRGSKPLAHVPGGGGKKALLHCQRGQEQVGTRCVDLGTKPWGAQLAF